MKAPQNPERLTKAFAVVEEAAKAARSKRKKVFDDEEAAKEVVRRETAVEDAEHTARKYIPLSKRKKSVPKGVGVTFGQGHPTGILRVLHPGTGQIHRIQIEGDAKAFHDGLVKAGYLHPHPQGPQILGATMAASAHAGRNNHVVTRRGYIRDGKHVDVSDVSVERGGKLLTGAAKRKALAEAGE
jgi:hypothetical protein